MSQEISDQDSQSAEVEPQVAEKVVSIRKAEANRQNALKSTGPRTRRGKAYSRRNAIKHGLFAKHSMAFQLLGESSQEYETLMNDLVERYQPIGRAEELEVERITLCWWKLKRVWRFEESVNHMGVRDVGKKELTRQEEYCRTLDKEEEGMIRELRRAKDEIETTGEVPQDLKQKVFATRPGFEWFWSFFERAGKEQLSNPPLSKKLQGLSPEEHSSLSTWLTITCAIGFIQKLGQSRTTGVMEVVFAQHVVPDREVLDRILPYETAVERSLGRALDRLERLQRRRKGEPILPPVSVRLTR